MFSPALAQSGPGGWSQIKRTLPQETARLNNTPIMERDMNYARTRFAEIRTVDDLMKDYRLLNVALTAHGLGDRIDDRAYIRKVLEEGIGKDSFSQKTQDMRFVELSRTFGFDKPFQGLDKPSIDRVLKSFTAQTYTGAVANEDPILGQALRAREALSALATSNMSNTGKWLTVISDTDLRGVFEKTLGIPPSMWMMDIDKQVDRLESAFSRRFGGDIKALSDPALQTEILDRFVVIASIPQDTSMTSGAIALALFQAQLS